MQERKQISARAASGTKQARQLVKRAGRRFSEQKTNATNEQNGERYADARENTEFTVVFFQS